MFTITLHEAIDSIPRLDLLLELLQAQLTHQGAGASMARMRSSLARALRPGSRARLLLLSRKATGEPAGFAFFNVSSGLESGGDYLWLNELHVAANLRGQGAGRQMLEFLQDWGRRNGTKAIYGVCGVKNGAARSFYQRLGFATEEMCWISKALVP
jgi:GNAT superfamily N-acetyltransferase